MSYLKIIRPGNFLFVGLCIIFGAIYPSFAFKTSIWSIIGAMAAGMLIAGGGYTVNDYYDLEIDRVNRPHRVLPSGRMSPRAAFIYGIALFVIGIISSYLTGSVLCLLLAFVNSIVLFLYACVFKRTLLMGNIVVAYAAGSSFIFGGLAGDNVHNSLIIACYAFFYTLLREIVKDMEDVDGDRNDGAKTVAICWKKANVLALSLIPIIGMTLFTVYLFVNDMMSRSIFVLLLFFVILPLIVFHRIFSRNDKQYIYGLLSRLMKIDMLVLLIILSLGRII